VRPRVVLVTDAAFGDDVVLRCVREVGAALPAGALCVQLRDKRRPLASLRLFAIQLRRVTRDARALLVINGQPRLARDVEADGVHLGGGGGEGNAPMIRSVEEARSHIGRRAWVSVAAHSDDDVRRATDEGADAVLVSPVYPTRAPSLHPSGAPTKTARGLDALRAARAIAGSRVAVFALGGVTPANARVCARAGASGVAVIRALLASPTPGAAARALHDALNDG
jgi:thiamine-phosphate pyrophosphorylase